MRVAYLVMAHRLPIQLARLVRHLRRAGGDVVVHVDRKSREEFGVIPGVEYVSRQVAVWWAGWSMIEAELALARTALPRHYDYYCLLSGQCYPIKPVEHFHSYLEANAPAEHIISTDVRSYWGAGLARFEKHFFEKRTIPSRLLNRLVAALPYRRRIPFGLTPYSGWTWWALTHEALERTVEALGEDGPLRRYFRWTMNADEVAVQTVICNSELVQRVSSRPTHKVEFPAGSPHPRIWRVEDLGRLRASPEYFARKFDPGVDEAVLDGLDMDLAV